MKFTKASEMSCLQNEKKRKKNNKKMHACDIE
jgi:hypothetical protein